MDNEDKQTVINILTNVGFYDNISKKGLKSTRMRDAIRDLPKAIAEIQKFYFTSN